MTDDFDKFQHLDLRFRRWTLALLMLVMFLVIAAWTANSAEPPKSYVVLRVREVIDVDTLRGDLVFGWRLVWEDVRVKADDFDGWESSRRRRTVGEITPEELSKGIKARDELAALLKTCHGVYVVPNEKTKRGLDPYGRCFGSIHINMPGEKELLSLKVWAEKNNHVRSKK